MKTATHNGLVCQFNPRWHTYTIKQTGQRLVSGTTFVGKFFPKFDADKVAAKIADKRGTTPEALKREWAEKGDRSRQKGTLVHEYAEKYCLGQPLPFSGGYSDNVYSLIKSVRKAAELLKSKGYNFIEAEKIIFSAKLGAAGQIDLLGKSRDNHILIVDWKTNKELKSENTWETGLPPVEHLDNCNLSHYALQLSLYQYIMEQEEYYPDAAGFKRLIIHLTPDGPVPYKVEYLKKEIKIMLKTFNAKTKANFKPGINIEVSRWVKLFEEQEFKKEN